MDRICLAAVLLIFWILPLGGLAQDSAPEGAKEPPKASAPATKRPRIPKSITFESALGDVEFPHRAHMKIGCQDCHHQIRAEKLETPHEAYLGYSWVTCQDCHREEAASVKDDYGCTQCHHTELENIADETLSSKVVLHTSCWKCHLSGTGPEASARCGFCHALQEEETPVVLETKPNDGTGSAAPQADTAR